jgi:hypothetical protein
MKKAITILFSLISAIAFAQTKSTVKVIHKQEKYFLQKNCSELIKWEEVSVPDKAISNKINTVIRRHVFSYKLSADEAKLFCDSSMEFTHYTEFKVVYGKNNLLSYNIAVDINYKDGPDGFYKYKKLNFNLQTGELIEFSDLIKASQLNRADAIIFRKITQSRFAFDDEDSASLRKELQKKEFTITDKGLEIVFHFDNSPRSMLVTYKELQPVVNMDGVLKYFYKKN